MAMKFLLKVADWLLFYCLFSFMQLFNNIQYFYLFFCILAQFFIDIPEHIVQNRNTIKFKNAYGEQYEQH